MKFNDEAIKLFDEMARNNNYFEDNCYFSSARPVKVNPKIIIDDITSKLKLDKHHVILDVGCGTGVITIPLSFKVKTIFALDGGFNVIEKLKENCSRQKIFNVNPINLTLNNSNFEDNFFDNILMFAVIQYMDNMIEVENCIKELIRICKPGGSILIAEFPEENAINSLKNKNLSDAEKSIIENFKKNRIEYDNFMSQFNADKFNFKYQELNEKELLNICENLNCEAKIMKQDIRQPLSLTRRDLLITIPN